MMTIEVGKHLNRLRARTINTAQYLNIPDDNEAAGELLDVVKAFVAAGTDAAIRKAAVSRIECSTSTRINDDFVSRYYHWQAVRKDRERNALTTAILEIAKPAIKAVYARWAEDYEQYRLACEQGVAKAP